MPAAFQLNVITQARTLMSGEVSSVTAPGTEGYLGIWAHHAPLVTALQPGKLTIKDTAGREKFYAVSGGFLEVSRNTVTLLADEIQAPQEIDVAQARREADAARQVLAEGGSEDAIRRAEVALRWALLRTRMGHHKESSHPG